MNKEDVEHVARLARLALKSDEIQKFSEQLNQILTHIKKLEKINTDDVKATAHPFFTETLWREDKVSPCPNIEGILDNAPDREENFFKVMKVIE